MYSILEHYLSTNHILMIGMIVTFILTFFLLEHPFSFLPSDQGRAFCRKWKPVEREAARGWFHFCVVLFNQQRVISSD